MHCGSVVASQPRRREGAVGRAGGCAPRANPGLPELRRALTLVQERLLRQLARPLLRLLPLRPLETIPLLRPHRSLRLTLPRRLGLVRGDGGQCRCSPGRRADGVSLHLPSEYRHC